MQNKMNLKFQYGKNHALSYILENKTNLKFQYG